VVSMTASVLIVPNKRAKSQVWRYFGFPGDSSGAIIKKKVVVCHLCPDNNEFPHAGNTMNLVTHLDRHHKTGYSDYLKASGKSTSESSLSSIYQCIAIDICAVIDAVLKGIVAALP